MKADNRKAVSYTHLDVYKRQVLDEPEVFKQGSKYGIKITAKAPTLHIIRTDITTEISPVVGSEKQSEDLVASLKEEMENSPNGIWDTNIFGKSLYEMVAEQMEDVYKRQV